MTLEPLVTVSWICEIWQGVSSLVLQARLFRAMSLGCSVAYFLAPAIMASQKPPVALVIRVTLMGPVAAPGAVMLVGAELVPTALVADGAGAGAGVGVAAGLVAAGAAALEVATGAAALEVAAGAALLFEPLLQPATSIAAAPSPASAF